MPAPYPASSELDGVYLGIYAETVRAVTGKSEERWPRPYPHPHPYPEPGEVVIPPPRPAPEPLRPPAAPEERAVPTPRGPRENPPGLGDDRVRRPGPPGDTDDAAEPALAMLNRSRIGF